jgi:ubiquinol-cytochrome c reductase cytochrome b subunit
VIVRRLILWIDDRLGFAPFVRHALRKAFPDHWSFMLGEIALYCYLVLLATGIYLGLVFDPSGAKEVYHGAYQPLDGQVVSAAYASALRISLETESGLLIRQMHHWAALIFVAAITVHASRVFFTGAFRKPRELNWMIGTTLLLLALLAGFTGYSLPDDMLSGTGLRIAVSIALSIPFVGAPLASALIGGQWPQAAFTGRLFFIHVFLLQGLIVGAITAHLVILWRQKHTQFRSSGRTARNVVGSPLWPQYAFKSAALGLGVAALITTLGAFIEINPIWQYGPYEPWIVASPAQPDWYVGWLDGALRLGPNWEPLIFGHPIPPAFWPGVAMPAVYFAILYAWPLIERKLTRDAARHELLDQPYDVPWRTGVGVALLTYVAVLEFGGSDDIFARFLYVPVESLVTVYRVLLGLLPLAFGLTAYRLCREFRARKMQPETRSGAAAELVRNAAGGYDAIPDLPEHESASVT